MPDARVPVSLKRTVISLKDRERIVYRTDWVQFGERLSELIEEKGLTVAEFAKQVGCTSTLVSKVSSGYIPVPEHALSGQQMRGGSKRTKVRPRRQRRKRWAEVLGLGRFDAKEFEAAGWLAQAPAQVVVRVGRLERQVAQLREENAIMRRGGRVRYVAPSRK
jgi:hypothetical protein